MSEITKLYENAEVKKQIPKVCSSNELYCNECEAHIEDAMPYCKNADYPPFTAEKQIELIKWISRKEGFRADKFSIEFGAYATGHSPDFEIALAKSINCFLEYCSSEEKQQIREILSNATYN